MNDESGEMLENIDLDTRKEIAKIGMTATLGITVATAPFLKGSKPMKNIHTGAGVLLAGFALWHHALYQGDKKKKLPKQTADKTAEAKTPIQEPAPGNIG